MKLPFELKFLLTIIVMAIFIIWIPVLFALNIEDIRILIPTCTVYGFCLGKLIVNN